ncbi:MAG: NADH:flavin oxidoreductase [Proteobacteria bacterium]|nr:NADH:flavin oxidoreductase [Pseudomonadota bacterium]
MFKPAQRIRFSPQPGAAPSRAEAAASRLFSPVDCGPMRLATRTWVPAMVPWRASPDGEVNADVIAWYARLAQGRPGAIVIEATGIRDVPSGPLLRIGDDRFVPGLARLVAAVREASGGETRLLIQLIDFLTIRRRPERDTFLRRFLPLTDALRARVGHGDDTAVREALVALPDAELRAILPERDWEALSLGYRERVTDTHLPQIAELPQVLPGLFAKAAARAEAAGFDGIELHYAHAYTMASFLSARNDRADGYGGPREARVRLPLEVFAAVRAAVSPNIAVGCRMLADECIAGGSGPDDAAWFAAEFARAGMDFLSLSRGGKFDDAAQPRVGEAAYPYTGPSGYECMPAALSDAAGPFGRNLAAARGVRAAVRAAGCTTPVVTAGGVHGFAQAEAMLHDGSADVVAAARQSLADPDWWLKLRSGHGAAVRVCEYSNYCEGLDQKHKQVTCKLWDRLDLTGPLRALASDGRRRLEPPAWSPAPPSGSITE